MTYAEIYAGSGVPWPCRGCGVPLVEGEGWFIVWRCSAGSMGRQPYCRACAEAYWPVAPWGGPVQRLEAGEGRSLVEEVRAQRRRAA